MGAKRQQGTGYQLSLFEREAEAVRPGASGESGTGTAAHEEPQTLTASERKRALTGDLMERVIERANLNRAFKRVKAQPGRAWSRRHDRGRFA